MLNLSSTSRTKIHLLLRIQGNPLQGNPCTCTSDLSSIRYSRRTRKDSRILNALGVKAAEMRVYEASKLRGPLESRDLVFYTHTLCPYAQRVWLTLLEKVIG